MLPNTVELIDSAMLAVVLLDSVNLDSVVVPESVVVDTAVLIDFANLDANLVLDSDVVDTVGTA